MSVEQELAATVAAARYEVGVWIAVRLRNLETLVAECREVVAVGGDAVDVFRLADKLGNVAGDLRAIVEKAAKDAGLVAA